MSVRKYLWGGGGDGPQLRQGEPEMLWYGHGTGVRGCRCGWGQAHVNICMCGGECEYRRVQGKAWTKIWTWTLDFDAPA